MFRFCDAAVDALVQVCVGHIWAINMSFLDQITVLILTYNEEANIGRTLDALASFSEVVVLDSGSTDATITIAAKHPNVRCVTRPFDTHAEQWTYGLRGCGIERPWVLALDADYVVSPELTEELAQLSPKANVDGYRASFRYRVFGRVLRGSLYPPVVVLYRRARTRYVQEGHTQRAELSGELSALCARIDHDDRKPLTRWLASQRRYATLEVDYLLATPRTKLSRNDRIRIIAWPAPVLVFLYTLIVKRCVLDGWPGWYYALQRAFAEMMIALEILDRRLRTAVNEEAEIDDVRAGL